MEKRFKVVWLKLMGHIMGLTILELCFQIPILSLFGPKHQVPIEQKKMEAYMFYSGIRMQLETGSIMIKLVS